MYVIMRRSFQLEVNFDDKSCGDCNITVHRSGVDSRPLSHQLSSTLHPDPRGGMHLFHLRDQVSLDGTGPRHQSNGSRRAAEGGGDG